jgi:SAM-dependent methyltransferase
MISLARERARDQFNVAFIDAEFPAFPFEDATFDFIASNTAIHHMNFEAALMAMSRLLRPGGRLAIVGLARSASARDYAPDLMGVPLNLGLNLTHAGLRAVGREDRSPSFPVKDPVMTWDDVRIGALRLLPGVQYRRHLLWRYSLQWRKPG